MFVLIKFKVLLLIVSIFLYLGISFASIPKTTQFISCSLPGNNSRQALFTLDNSSQKISYEFIRNGKVELKVLFNEHNNLLRFYDHNMGVLYYGFKRGQYSYVFMVIKGVEKDEYSMSFDVKKDDKVIQSSDCLPSSFRSNDVNSKFIRNVSSNGNEEFDFP
jgi:hypothetical protein